MSSRAGSRSRKRVGAFFDVDKTLISENSGSLYMKHRYQQGEISEMGAAEGAGDLSPLQAGSPRHRHLEPRQ